MHWYEKVHNFYYVLIVEQHFFSFHFDFFLFAKINDQSN